MQVTRGTVTLGAGAAFRTADGAAPRPCPKTACRWPSARRRPPARCGGDADLLCDLLLNLVTNAVRAAPKDGCVHLDVTAAADRVQFAVWDTGRGIPPRDLPRLTEPFYMVDKSRARAGGGRRGGPGAVPGHRRGPRHRPCL